MVHDTIRTESLSNKLKIWYGPTYWRPDDAVEKERTLGTINFDEKFSPPLNIQQKVFAIIQLFSIVIFAGILATSISSQTHQETSIFGLTLVLIVLLTSLILENKSYALSLHLISSCLLLLLIYMGGVFNDGLLATQFLIFHAVANALFLTMVMILKRFGVDEVFDKASKQD